MDINYQDKNLIVMYLQIFLRESVGMTVRKVIPRDKLKSTFYEITTNESIKVTGYYNEQTYTAIALYMAYNYPNEGYPLKWTLKPSTNKWYSEDYVYTGDQEELLKVIANNLSNYSQDRRLIYIPERVLSYVFNEVVTQDSTPEEILRVKQKIYYNIYADEDHREPLQYHKRMFDEIVKRQLEILQKYQSSLNTITTTLTGEYLRQKNDKGVFEKTSILKNNFRVQRSAIETLVTATDSDSLAEILRKYNGTYSVETSTIRLSQISTVYSIKLVYRDSSGKLVEVISEEVNTINSSYEIKFKELPPESDIETVTVTYDLPYESYSIASGVIVFKEPLEEDQTVVVTQKVIEAELPEQLEGFKITGYFDPWTERFMKEGAVADV